MAIMAQATSHAPATARPPRVCTLVPFIITRSDHQQEKVYPLFYNTNTLLRAGESIPPFLQHKPPITSRRKYTPYSRTQTPYYEQEKVYPVLYTMYMYMILSPAVGAFGGHKNSTFYVKSAMSPEGRYSTE